MIKVYYNDIDSQACDKLHYLIRKGVLPAGDIDDRSIIDVSASDVRGYDQCHFFAGIGGWPYALQLARWPEERQIWTGSCPCPPFSVAGRKKACPECESINVIPNPCETGVFACCGCGHEWFADGRHLWPEFFRLISECKPPVVAGEQVASEDGRIWLSGVRIMLEASGYGVGSADLCASGVGAPHIRQRLYWVGVTDSAGRIAGRATTQTARHGSSVESTSGTCGVADTTDDGHTSTDGLREEAQPPIQTGAHSVREPSRSGNACGVADTAGEGSQGHREPGEYSNQLNAGQDMPTSGMVNSKDSNWWRDNREECNWWRTASEAGGSGPWSECRFILCRDGKIRRIPTEPTLFPVANGVPGRVGLLRGYGNAIVPQVAAEFLMSYMECKEA